MTWFSRSRGASGRLESRVIASGQILHDDDEVVIQHGYHKYRLRATRSGRLKMSGNRLAVEVRWIGLAFVFFLGYLAGLPVVVVLAPPSIEPALQVVYAPAIVLYECCPPYESYVEWLMEVIGDRLSEILP